MSVVLPQLAPAAVRVLFELIGANAPMEFSQLAQRVGLDTSATSSVLRSLEQVDAVEQSVGMPGLQRPQWRVTESGVRLGYALEFAALQRQEGTPEFEAAQQQFVAAQPPQPAQPAPPASPTYNTAANQPNVDPATQPLIYSRLAPSNRKGQRNAKRAMARAKALNDPLPVVGVTGKVGSPLLSARTRTDGPLTPPSQSVWRPASNRAKHATRSSLSISMGRSAAGTRTVLAKLFGSRRRVVATLVTLAVVITGFFAFAGLRAVNFTITGVEPDDILHPANLVDENLSFAVDGGNLGGAKLLLDGLPVSGLQRSANNFNWVVPSLTDGTHTVSLEVPRRLFGTATAAVSFTVDSVPPDLGLPRVLAPVPLDEAFVLTAQIDPNVDLLIDGVPIDTSTGTFTIERALPPSKPISFVAVDEAGNTTTLDMVVPIAYPDTNGVHVTAAAWNHDGLRAGIIDLIQANKISAVQLDLKDESGNIGYASDIPLAQQTRSTLNLFELEDAVDELHALGVRVIGRIVAFRDPKLGRYAIQTDNLDWVLQNLNGQPLPTPYGRGAFTNFSNETVRQYNLDIAVEAAEAGVDDVLWDYMRRPEGNFSEMVVPGFDGSDPSPLIVSFLAEAGEMLRTHQVYHGVSVFGIAARRGDLIAQDVVAISDHVDYVSPMVYPSHWGRGEYGVSHPEAQPYDITSESLQDFQRVLEGTNTAIVPWLQDFTIRVPYGADEVQAQIDAASDIGISNWLLWDPTVTYTPR